MTNIISAILIIVPAVLHPSLSVVYKIFADILWVEPYKLGLLGYHMKGKIL